MNDEFRVRAIAFAITSRFEGGGYAAYQNSDDSIISYGRFQFALISGALGRVIDRYLEESTTPTAVALRAFQTRIQICDPSLRRNQELRDLLASAASEPIMQQVQDEIAAEAYWEPIKRIAILPRGLETPLAWALLFDVGIQFGVGDGFLRMAEREYGVPTRSRVGQNGLTEAKLITRVAELRKLSHDRQAAADNLPGLRVRGDFWLKLVRQGDWQLAGDRTGMIYVKGKGIRVRDEQADTESDPTSDEDTSRFYVIATEDRIRVRSQPGDGDKVGLVRRDEVIEVLDPWTEAASKVGLHGQWLHVRLTDGTEGYTAAWFYHIHEINEDGSEAEVQAQSQAAAPEPDALFLVTAIDDQVRIRANSMVGDTIGMVSRGDVLHVLESRAEALPKIGKPDLWLHVLAPDGTDGYAAAWYFALYQPPESQPDAPSSPVAPPPTVMTPLPPGPVFITPTDNRVRIRTRPIDGEPISLVSRGDVLVVLDSRLEAIQKIGVPNQWLHVRTPSGTEGYVAAWYFTVHDPVAPPPEQAPEPPSPRPPAPMPEALVYVTPIEDRVRVRARPVDGDQIGLASRGDVLRVLEPRAEALPKIGEKGQWLRVQLPNGAEGAVAAWFFRPFEGPLPKRTIDVNLTGVNLDLFHAQGIPDPAWLGTLGWVRLVYNVSLDPDQPIGSPTRYGNTDLEAAYQRYHPILQGYAQAGFKVLLVLTHQTYGEGAGYNWQAMDAGRWQHLSERFAALAGEIAAQYRGTNIVQAYQIWNEMDAHSGARSSVSIPAESYADLLARCIQAIRAGDPRALVITGGHASGVEMGVAYARETLQALPAGIRPDGIAIHPYGRGTPQTDPRFRPFGYIDHEINAYAALMPGWPIWITEWGILNRPDEAPDAVAHYAREVIGRLKSLYSHKVAAAIWFAWAQGMDNGYGLVDQYHQPRGSLTEEFVTL